MRLLLVEDDAALAAALIADLHRRGFASDAATNREDATHFLGTSQYGAMILDLGLPDGDGLDLVRQLRTQANPLPVLVLTARGDLESRILGLEAGADDYLAKPFAPDELVARLRAILRRSGSYQGREILCGNLTFDTDNTQLTIAGQPVALSQREAALLGLLLRRTGLVVTKRLAEDQLFGAQDLLGSNAIEVYVHRLRQKLEAAASSVEIVTIRGVGYLLRTVQPGPELSRGGA